MPPRLRREEYTVGWVCARPVELAAAQEMLDEEHDSIPSDAHDTNIYTCGRIGEHNVVIACLPKGRTGTTSAASVASQMRLAFSHIRFGLMVGIGGGVPSEEVDIRLGDVVVSSPDNTHGGVVQYDFGKTKPDGFEQTGSLNAPPTILLNATAHLHARHIRNKGTLQKHISRIENLTGFGRSTAGPDTLFDSTYDHTGGRTCNNCDDAYLVHRQMRAQEVVVHYGTVASGDQVMRSAAERDKVSAMFGGVLCFEKEAAGLMNSFPCLIIRGICDYADSHKNKRWQAYAAGTAAAYAKDLLLVIPGADVMKTHRVGNAINGTSKRRLQSLSPDRGVSKRRKPDITDNAETGFAEQQIITLPIPHQGRTQTNLSEEQKESLLESLAFDQIDARQMTIRNAHARTCQWLLKNDRYLQWNDASRLVDHHGFLWIKGKAGTGKSTIMKFAFDNACRTMKDRLVLSFFFNARGENIEKSTTGTYRSLLLQLLKRVPTLQSVFGSLGLLASKISADHQWTIESLQTLLAQAIQGLGDSAVVCFIDALDECDEDQVRGMIQFFEYIGDLALPKDIRFQVCFSSRHYPHITIRNGLELVLEGQEGHTQDITNYIETELKIGKSQLARQVRIEVQEKASGIFMWVVLVVGILNKESDSGQVHTLQQKLREIPGDLNELFRDILTRDTHNKERLILCIQWVLFAKKPLKPEQLYYAILSGVAPEAVTQWDPEEVTEDVIQRFILDSSKGLAEATVSIQRSVQFIHESVRDFLLKENGLGKIWPEYRQSFQAQSHEKLKQCCLNYISVDVATPLKIPNHLPKASSQEAVDLRKSATQAFPFLEYAVRNVLYHADTAEGGGISQTCFLDSFPLRKWVKLDNLMKNLVLNVLDLFEEHEMRRHTEHVSLLYLLAELDMANLINTLGSVSRCMDVEAERYGCPLFAAAAMSNEKTLNIFMNSVDMQRAEKSPIVGISETLFLHRTAHSNAGRDFDYSKSKDFLWNAMELGHDGVLALSIRSGKFNVDLKDLRGSNLLWMAFNQAWELSARALLTVGSSMVNSRNESNESLLYVAAEEGNKVLIGALLESGANTNLQCGYYGNALQAASAEGHTEIVELLLDKGANINAKGGSYGSALYAASYFNHIEVVKLLLDKGADVNAQGAFFGNALQAASYSGYKEAAELLTDNGANVNAHGGYFGNALQAASCSGQKEVVRMLLDNGADVNAKGGYFGNALQAASYLGKKEVVKLLLDNGAEVNLQGGQYGNALQAASYFSRKGVVELLLDNGADVNAKGGYFGSALQAASFHGNKEVVELLLNNGADVNAQGGEYGSALQAALVYDRKEVITLLENRVQ